MSADFTFSKPRWEFIKDTKVFETPVFSLHQIDLIPSGKENTVPFYRLHAPDWINIIALTAQNEIVLVEQYRAGIDRPTLETPGGMVDPHEKPLDAAKRELLEETGFRAEQWTPIGRASSNAAILDNYTYFFLAEGCEQTDEPRPDALEDIAVHRKPMEDFLELVRDGTVHHSVVVAAVAQFLLHGKTPGEGGQP